MTTWKPPSNLRAAMMMTKLELVRVYTCPADLNPRAVARKVAANHRLALNDQILLTCYAFGVHDGLDAAERCNP